MKIGDKVRFLSDVGGGKIAGFQGTGVVLVEDEDGFQIPTPVNEVVVIEDDDFSTGRMVKAKQEQKKPVKVVPDDDEDYDPADRPVTFKAKPQERKGGNMLSAYLAFVPVDIKELTRTRFEAYFVNDSNYTMRYIYMYAQDGSWQLRATDEVEPNTKVFIEEFGREDLAQLERVCVQLVAYKKDKPFIVKPAVDVQLRIDTVKFYKLHTFTSNNFFEQHALVYTIVENDRQARTLAIDPDKLKEELVGAKPKEADRKPRIQPARVKADDPNAPVVVDLHATELLETTAGMSSSDILNYQLEVFRKTLRAHAREKGRKVVFIHGKGEGVLRAALINELRYRFKPYTYQDASFQEYGYGATQITIK